MLSFCTATLRVVQALMLVVDEDVSLTITGIGDVIEPSDGIIGECISVYKVAAAHCVVK